MAIISWGGVLVLDVAQHIYQSWYKLACPSALIHKNAYVSCPDTMHPPTHSFVHTCHAQTPCIHSMHSYVRVRFMLGRHAYTHMCSHPF